MDLDDIIGSSGSPYDIIGRGGEFNGAYNNPGYPQPNWGPVPGYGPSIGPMALAFGANGEAVVPEGGAPMAPMGPGPFGPWGYPPGYPCGPGFVAPNGNFAASLIAAKESLLLQPNAWAKARREPLGFGCTCVEPCETVTIEAEPQVYFKPYRLVVPSSVAFQFIIHQVKFGKWNLFANGGAVPAAAFIETATDIDFNGDTVQPSGKITLVVQNISNAKAEFCAAIWGKAIEGC